MLFDYILWELINPTFLHSFSNSLCFLSKAFKKKK